MKNLFLLLFLFILLACGKEDSESVSSSTQPTFPDNETLIPYQTERIDYKRALSIAQAAPTRFGGEFTKGVTKTVLQGEPIVSQVISTKSDNTQIDTLMYIFNYAEGGYAVIPTLDIESDLIAYIEEGEFNIQDTVTDDLSRFLVSLMMDYQQSVVATYNTSVTKGMLRPDPRKDPIGPKCRNVVLAGGMNYNFGEPTAEAEVQSRGDEYYKTYGCYLPMRYTDHEEKYLGPLLTTTWGQGDPYNAQTKLIGNTRAKTGCVAMAVAQIMVYHGNPAKYPSTILNFEVPSAFRYVGMNTSLAAMKKIKDLKTQGSFAARDHISRFIAVIGYMLKNDWGVGSTGAKDKEVPKVFNNMGYGAGGLLSYNGIATEASLNSGEPVYITGWEKYLISGHAWVVDGYKTEDYTEEFYYYYFGPDGAYHGRRRQSNVGTSYTHIYFHHNFGWSGNANGYYIDGVFDTSKVYEATGDEIQDNDVYSRIEIIPNITAIK